MHNMRFHMIALSGIIITVLIIFASSGKLKGPPEAEPKAVTQTILDAHGDAKNVVVEEPIGDRFVTIWEGSWGLNCNEQPNRFGNRRFGQSNTPPAPAKKRVKFNNVRDTIAPLCDGKLGCEFNVDVETLGNPAEGSGCRPILELVYRCYSYDKPWRVTANMGETVTINCKGK